MKRIAAIQFVTGAAASLVLLLNAVPRPGVAQQPHGLNVGDHVRVGATLPSGTHFGPTVVVFQGATADTLWVRQRQQLGSGLYRDSVTAIHWRSVTALEVSRGHRDVGTGALVGALIGAAAFGIALADGCGDGACEGGSPGAYIANIAGFGAGGAAVGALVGLTVKGTGPWVPVAVPTKRADADTTRTS